MDGEKLSPSFFDLDKDLSYFDDDNEKTNKYSHEFEDLSGSLDSSSNTSFNPYNVSDEDLGSIDLNPRVVRIGGERINGQSPDLGLIIEFRDGKPVIKGVTNRKEDSDDNIE
jgi:hypothetical protein